MSHLAWHQQQHQWASSEAVPLNQHHQQQQQQQQQQESYSTFQQQQYTETAARSRRLRPWHCLFFPVEHKLRQKDISVKSFLMFVLVLLVGLYMGHSSNQTRRRQQMKQQESENVTFPHHTGTWIWDYNVYHNNNNNNSSSASPTASTTTTTTAVRSSSNNNNLLLTQIASSRSLQELSDISSLPNRAYARQWRRDYVQILCASTADRKQQQQESSSLEEKSCFAKVFVLQWLLQKHNDTSAAAAAAAAAAVGVDTANGSSRSSSNNGNNKATTKTTTTMTTTTVPYDTVALLPPDAIVTDLDYDLEQLLPADKLVAIAGDWQQQIQKADDDKDNGKQILAAAAAGMTDVVFFNLRHKHAAQVVQLWFDAVANPNHHVTCEAGNDLQLLFEVMRSVVQNDEDKFQSMIHSLIQTEQGFIMGGTNNNNNNKKDGDNNNNNTSHQEYHTTGYSSLWSAFTPAGGYGEFQSCVANDGRFSMLSILS